MKRDQMILAIYSHSDHLYIAISTHGASAGLEPPSTPKSLPHEIPSVATDQKLGFQVQSKDVNIQNSSDLHEFCFFLNYIKQQYTHNPHVTGVYHLLISRLQHEDLSSAVQ